MFCVIGQVEPIEQSTAIAGGRKGQRLLPAGFVLQEAAHRLTQSNRRRDLVMPVVGPEEMAREIRSTPGRSAILFGPERSGLESEDVALATRVVTVPINPDFGSLNLAQAVILLAYEWSRGADLAQPTLKEAEPPAPMAELDGLIAQLDADLDRVGYFHPPERTPATQATIRTILTKAQWSSREVKALRGMIRALAEPKGQRG